MESVIRNQRAYDLWALTYDNDRPPHTYLETPVIIEAIDAQAGDVILDAACGTGRYSLYLQPLAAQVYGCDVSAEMLHVAKKKVPQASFQQLDLNCKLPYVKNQFSKVLCSLAIRHVENLRGFLGEVYRVLKPGGKFVFSAIHPEMDWSSYERSNPPPIELNSEGQIFPYSVDELLASLQESGFVSTQMRELYADSSIAPMLTPESFAQQNNKKFVLVVTALRGEVSHLQI